MADIENAEPVGGNERNQQIIDAPALIPGAIPGQQPAGQGAGNQQPHRAQRAPVRRVYPDFEDAQPVLAGAIVLPPLMGGAKFDVTSTMIQLLNSRGLFTGLPSEDPNQHIWNFTGICAAYQLPGVSQEAIRLRLFPFSLTGEALSWLVELPDASIHSWEEMVESFLEKYFPPSKRLLKRDEIWSFKQQPGEALHEAWLRFKQLMKKCPNQ